MKVFLDCMPCILRQALEASRMATDSETLQDEIMSQSIKILDNFKAYRNAPELCREVHRIVREKTGVFDPYIEIKKRDIETALQLYPKLKQLVKEKNDRMYWALKVAATGNVLDSAINTGLNIEECVEAELQKPFKVCGIKLFEEQLSTAKNVLVIGDNTGETVFDRVLIEELQDFDVTYAVRSAPIINDATAEDARNSGLDKCARIISSGCDVAGTMLDECEKDFLNIFYNADIVISKGQGNYETLSDCDRDLYFLLKAKCSVLSNLLGVSINEYVFKYTDNRAK